MQQTRLALVLVALSATPTEAFLPPRLAGQKLNTRENLHPFVVHRQHGSPDNLLQLNLFDKLFRRNKSPEPDGGKDQDDEEKDSPKETSVTAQATLEKSEEKDVVAFDGPVAEVDPVEAKPAEAKPVEAKPVEAKPAEVKKVKPTYASEKERVVAEAKMLKEKAKRARLEAEKAEAELTLEKLAKLEKELNLASLSAERKIDIKNQVEMLNRRLRGEPITPVEVPKPPAPASASATALIQVGDVATFESPVPKKEGTSQEEIEKLANELEKAPDFLKDMLASMTGVSADNNTALSQAMLEQKTMGDRSNLKGFTQEQIDEKVEVLKMMPSFLKKDNNDTLTALMLLEDERRNGDDWLNKALKKELQPPEKRAEDSLVNSLYPKSTRKESEGPSESQMKMFVSECLTDSFAVSGTPSAVPGGFLIRGTKKQDNATEMIETIDKKLKRSTVSDKVSYYLIKDVKVDDETQFDPEYSWVLFLTGPDVVGERNRILLTLTSMVGFATTWYFSIYPFLVNDNLMKRAEEQLSYAEAGMPYNLDFLTDSASPLFLTLVAIQVAHEVSHRLVAGSKKLPITIPTVVPSITTGFTGLITTLEKPAKNLEDLFDFAVAGPLVGSICSLAALFIGLGLTASASQETLAALPQVPLSFVRQSTLGGAMIDAFLGVGTTFIPEGADPNVADQMKLSLHPIAIGGFMALLINALSFLPVGRTDGGRMATAVIGRDNTRVAGFVTMLTLFIDGFTGSETFFYYFAFLTFFENELEIPARNEVDGVDFGRALIAILCGVFAILTLTPM